MLGILFGDKQWLYISRSELLETGYIEIQSSEHIFAKFVDAVKKLKTIRQDSWRMPRRRQVYHLLSIWLTRTIRKCHISINGSKFMLLEGPDCFWLYNSLCGPVVKGFCKTYSLLGNFRFVKYLVIISEEKCNSNVKFILSLYHCWC